MRLIIKKQFYIFLNEILLFIAYSVSDGNERKTQQIYNCWLNLADGVYMHLLCNSFIHFHVNIFHFMRLR